MSGETAHPDAFVFGPPREVERALSPIEQARRDRDEGLARVEAGADDGWSAYAYAWACAYLRTHDEWFPDDSWSLGLAEPREARAFGPVVLRLIRAGYMVKSGEFRERTRGHAALGPVWRSRIYSPTEKWSPPDPPRAR